MGERIAAVHAPAGARQAKPGDPVFVVLSASVEDTVLVVVISRPVVSGTDPGIVVSGGAGCAIAVAGVSLGRLFGPEAARQDFVV